MPYTAHESAIVDAGAAIGEGTRIWHWVHICAGARIGSNCSFGQGVFVGNDVVIGNNCKLQNNVSIYDGVTLEDDVFCGPSMVFTNVYNPRAAIPRKHEYRRTLVKRGATIGANATVVCGVSLGEYSFIAAGAVITGNVEPFALMAGVPARRIGWMNESGERVEAPPLQVMDFVNLKVQQAAIKPELDRRMAAVLAHGRYIMGPEVFELEDRLAAYTEARHCISVASGTEALLISLMALGIGRSDEVITTPFSFAASAEVIALLGARPVFVDVDEATCNIDPSRIEAAITDHTKAIMPVSLYGQAADMDEINAIAARHGNIPVIEDAAQSFGATYKGRSSCNLSTIGCTSFYPSKPLGCYGDGGAIFTDDAALAQACREIRVHGQSKRYVHGRIGVGGRMDTLQCAIVLAKLERFDWEVEQRRVIGARYTALLSSSDAGLPAIATPYIAPHGTSVYAQYTIQVDCRDALVRRLMDAGIPTAVHYPLPLHLQPAFAAVGDPAGRFPMAERVARRVVSLPMHADLTATDQERVVEALASAMAKP